MTDNSFGPDDEPRVTPAKKKFYLAEFIVSNIVFFSTSLVAILFVMNLLATSYGDGATALGLLASSGPAAVLTAMLVQFITWTFATVIMFVIVMDDEIFGLLPKDFQSTTRLLVYGVLSVMAFMALPAISICLAILIGLSTFSGELAPAYKRMRATRATYRSGRTKRMRETGAAYNSESTYNSGSTKALDSFDAGSRRSKQIAATLLIPLLLLQMLVFGGPWIPSENIELPNKKVMVGYVISTQDDWVTVLSDNDRELQRLPSTDIKSRQICVKGIGWARITLANIVRLVDRPDYPPCRQT